ncbi:cAMP-dependent protein kinase regulator [Cryptococcus neoformans C23]|uniref:cAMP-dependent protein kinase regulatory subunit n=3 Tax=Cryptococcus neoformans species complex TaxID=1897064 RepID=A0A854QP22_CRYNE|nr:cAMP-dependent protein kinase regulator [Cryptococcus neoformans var. grubii H99]AAG30146.1 cAMP dependent protein kinase regulatory subunit [Cryptococcus neoformans var. grubii]OWZ36488.1 cAMP-dependent protein kinase regulator [Cryptococcus neoformans var. grubii AD2-60a]OWZ48157.1 cAMP-dependent protein kinase regulator [Cryptococcus neoformans var. grubii C23]OWZ56721.1 cAMP-dependent protein kinase regulator [Cryptococcus neoformans var. grubii AD1-83a]OWZ57926.1 cAMP-dependent protein|eukprot:XP_012046811.1 cAMP-dependent protein kinase regulator [Cryptococcus neoformans var. grubii H99]
MSSWTDILNDLNRDIALDNPTDVLQWGADWFQHKLRQERQNSNASTRQAPSGTLAFNTTNFGTLPPHALSPFSEMGPSDSPFGPTARRATVPADSNLSVQPLFSTPFGTSSDVLRTDDRSPFSEGGGMPFDSSPFGGKPPSHGAQDDPPIPSYALGRRTSVSAESLVPTSQRGYGPTSGLETTMEEDENTVNLNSGTPVFPKSEEQLARIRQAIKPNFLFRNLDDEQEADVLAAMKEVKVDAGEVVIEQGAAGDFFYIVENGRLDVFVNKEGQVLDLEKGDRQGLGKKVAECSEGSSFGELALMHNAPRAASIISLTPCTLWALDRVSFRTILLDHTSRKRRLYESFLSEVPILASLQPQERAKIADVLESRTYNEGEDVIRQGDAGDEFFLIESGNAMAIKTDEDGNASVVKHLGQGEYFGELALLNRRTRAATIRAEGPDKLRVAALGEQAFTRLLGPVKDIMARSVSERYGFSTGRGSV